MAGPIATFLVEDHVRLDALLRRAIARPGEVDGAPWAELRAGLLRHIGMEEKILLPAARRAQGGTPLGTAAQLRRDHAALVALLVPTPTPEIVRAISGILETHNAIEEGPGGVYDTCDALLGAEAEAIVDQLRAAPEVPVMPHFDGPRAHEHIRELLAAREAKPREG